MHIAMLAATPQNSHGWGRYTRGLIEALARLDVEITLITSTDAPADPGLPLRRYHRALPSLTPAPRLSTLRILTAIPVVQRLTASADIVHVIAEPYALATLPLRKAVLVTAHGTYLPQTLLKGAGIGALYRRAYYRGRIICVSGYTERRIQAVLPGAKTTAIPNGVEVARYAAKPASLPAKVAPSILAVGQIKARKGYHVLAAAMRSIRAAVPDTEAIFIGDTSADPGYVESMRAGLAADGTTEAVRWLGRAPDETLLGWFHAADLFALPAVNVGGRFEGFGLVYLEASAAGLPVIGTRDCGAEDAIRDGETGFLVPQNDPGAVAEAAIRLLRDPALHERMGKAGAAYAMQHTWDRVAAQVRTVYVGTKE